jgi:uncharacterized membrane protein YhhN
MILIPLIFASAVLDIIADYRGRKRLVHIFKPLATSLILAAALLAPQPVSPVYQTLVVIGLAFSLLGDVFLLLPSNRFIAGLLSFLAAHLFYIAAFTSDGGWRITPWLLLPWLVYAAVFLRLLLPHAGRFKAPIIVYGLVIAAMAWQALERWAQVQTAGAFLAFAGAALFVLSDSALAVNRFARPFRSAQAVVLSTYWAGQLLIALSVWY